MKKCRQRRGFEQVICRGQTLVEVAQGKFLHRDQARGAPKVMKRSPKLDFRVSSIACMERKKKQPALKALSELCFYRVCKGFLGRKEWFVVRLLTEEKGALTGTQRALSSPTAPLLLFSPHRSGSQACNTHPCSKTCRWRSQQAKSAAQGQAWG